MAAVELFGRFNFETLSKVNFAIQMVEKTN